MPKFIDLTGKKFPYFEVIKYIGRNKDKKSVWELKCQCGKIMTSSTHSILSQKKVSCGCHQSYSREEYFEKVKKELLEKRKINGDCWEWPGFRFKGYGRRNFGQRGKKRKVEVHRIAYMIWKGEIPKGMHICHTCDNRACYNPDHLWLGTPKDNIHDMINKGRRNIASKLKKEDVLKIRERRESGEKMSEIVKDYPVNYQAIYFVCKRKTWKNI